MHAQRTRPERSTHARCTAARGTASLTGLSGLQGTCRPFPSRPSPPRGIGRRGPPEGRPWRCQASRRRAA
eukprot:1743919-Prymnesium_polylepis.1